MIFVLFFCLPESNLANKKVGAKIMSMICRYVLSLVNKLDDDLTKYQISDVLEKEEERLSNLYEEFCIDINWEQKNWFGFIN